MVKSTPISQIASPPPQQSRIEPPVVHTNNQNEDINIEDLIHEKEKNEHQAQQFELQNQIEMLKRQIEMTKKTPQVQAEPIGHPQIPSMTHNAPLEQRTNLTDSIINKNSLLMLISNLDYKLFVVVFIVVSIMYSTNLREFISNKLEDKNLTYLTSYIQSFVSSVGVVVLMKSN